MFCIMTFYAQSNSLFLFFPWRSWRFAFDFFCASAVNRMALCAELFVWQRWQGHPKMQRRSHGSHPPHWRIQPSFPPVKNVNSADRSLTSACHFGGSCAKVAKIANFVQQKMHLSIIDVIYPSVNWIFYLGFLNFVRALIWLQ